MLAVSVGPGEEVLTTLTRKLAEHHITDGAIVSIIGAVDACCISNMPPDDPSNDILTEHTLPLEMSGTGEIKNGTPHIHCVLSSTNNKTLAGHLHWAKVTHWFVNIYILPTP